MTDDLRHCHAMLVVRMQCQWYLLYLSVYLLLLYLFRLLYFSSQFNLRPLMLQTLLYLIQLYNWFAMKMSNYILSFLIDMQLQSGEALKRDRYNSFQLGSAP